MRSGQNRNVRPVQGIKAGISTSVALMLLALLTANSSVLSAQTWTQRTPPSKPAGRCCQGMAYDSTRGQIVMFGGQVKAVGPGNDTWVWNGGTWIQQFPATSPPPRRSTAMAYDQARRQVVLFGGNTPDYSPVVFGDTWLWDGTNWREVAKSPSPHPSPRFSHAMVYDEARQRVILFGGADLVHALPAETWEWDGTSWTQLPLGVAQPPGRYGHSMAYDSARAETVLYGGFEGGYLAETWVWNGVSWTLRSPTGPTPVRAFHSMVYDKTRNMTILFGGVDVNGVLLADTWHWNGSLGTWAKQTLRTSPSGRYGLNMAYYADRQNTVLFGGYDYGNDLDETWVYPEVDTDSDGLPDDWETNGVTINGIFVNLPDMGANPRRKDLFVEIDWLEQRSSTGQLVISYRPSRLAMEIVIKAFLSAPVNNPDGSTGITLHIDHGPSSVMNPSLTQGALTGAPWGSLSRSNPVTSTPGLQVVAAGPGGTDDWTPFDQIKTIHFTRSQVFHYAVFGNILENDPSLGGISRNGVAFRAGAGDLAVAAGTILNMALGNPNKIDFRTLQASIFMHELGHNLGLSHGGVLNDGTNDHINGKPNYLSIMNYIFTGGLIVSSSGQPRSDLAVDYSRTKVNSLNETSLSEGAALGLGSQFGQSLYGTKYFCGSTNIYAPPVVDATANIDWNCNGHIDSQPLQAYITVESPGLGFSRQFIAPESDWANLVFIGGSIGSLLRILEPALVAGISEPRLPQILTVPASGRIPCIGDANGDGLVNSADLVIIRAAFGSTVGTPRYDDRADLFHDGVINIVDLSLASRSLGCANQ